jgi:hypothetical protein
VKPSRRALLVGLGAAAILPIHGTYMWWRYVRRDDPRPLLRAVLARHLGRLHVEGDGFERFTNEFAMVLQSGNARGLAAASPPHSEWKSHWPSTPDHRKIAWADTVSWLYQRVDGLADLFGDRFRLFEDGVVTAFLLSTDFFHSGADINAPVRYTGLYNPGLTPCSTRALAQLGD